MKKLLIIVVVVLAFGLYAAWRNSCDGEPPTTQETHGEAAPVIEVVDSVEQSEGDGTLAGPETVPDRGRAALKPDTPAAVATEIPVAPVRGFVAGGRLRIIGATAPPQSVTLHWTSDAGGETLVSVDWTERRWDASFTAESMQLIRVQIDGVDGSFAAAPVVTRDAPTADIELATYGTVILDVRSAAPPHDRLPIASAFLVPKVVDGQVHIERTSLSRDRSLAGYAPFGTAAWRVHLRPPPFQIPVEVHGESIRVFAKDFTDSEMIEVPRSGFLPVLLQPARQLVLAVGEEVSRSSRYDIEVLDTSGKPLHHSPGYLGPEPLRVSIDGPRNVVVTIARTPQMGAPFDAKEYPVELREIGQTFFVIPAPSAAADDERSSLKISIAALDPDSPMKDWRVRLVPNGESVMDMLRDDERYSRLSTWRDVRPDHECETTLTGIRPGDYTLRIDPVGHEQPVSLVAGQTTTIAVSLGEPCRLTIRGVNAIGNAIDIAGLGSLAWAKVPPGADRDAPDGKWTPDIGKVLIGGRYAKHMDGAWFIETNPGKEIQLVFLGPKAFGAEPLRVALKSGPCEATLRFANLGD